MQQQITTGRQQANDRLQQQLPINTIKETTKPIHYKRVNQISQSAPNRFDKLTGTNQQQWPLRRLHTNLDDFDTHCSLSSCPTYSSLSAHSPETRECATQITTLTPIETVEDNQDLSTDSSLPIDNNQVLVIDEIPTEELELMPISSGFGYYPYNYPTTRRVHRAQPQIVSRAPQFRDKNQNGYNNHSGTKSTGKLSRPRPTAVKQSSPRSDTYALPTKRNEVNTRVSKDDMVSKNSQHIPRKERFARNFSTPPPQQRRTEFAHRNDVTRPVQKNRNLPNDQQDFPRKPLHFANKKTGAYRSSSPPAYYQKSSSLPRNIPQKSRRMRVANNEYIIERRRQPMDYIYDDYRTETPVERRRRSQRVVRVLRDTPYQDYDDDDVYYVEPASTRQPRKAQRPSPREYIYVDETSAPTRHHRSGRREVVYIEDDEPQIEYEDEYIYVDENGNEIDFIDEGNPSKQYVEYIDDDGRDRRRSHKSKILYVDDEPPINQRRNKSKSKHPSSTRIVYE
ncbi:unnamed protein product [Rotaria sordida]|uniref:Uncharacterized protein n=1 Tax=Rotaria sordida TaxID=392033 RepID=A0A814Z839_9BILA|nr:unnamed protein product [Rotaria sordida]CAF1238372.1 unnamed protein product [Rotaria sordida]